MNKPRATAKTDALAAIFKADINTPIKVAAKATSCCSSYAGDVKRWVRDGCVGPVKIRYNTTHNYTCLTRKKQGVERKLVKVKCLGCDRMFLSENKFVRVCQACVGMRAGSIGSGFHAHAIL